MLADGKGEHEKCSYKRSSTSRGKTPDSITDWILSLVPSERYESAQQASVSTSSSWEWIRRCSAERAGLTCHTHRSTQKHHFLQQVQSMRQLPRIKLVESLAVVSHGRSWRVSMWHSWALRAWHAHWAAATKGTDHHFQAQGHGTLESHQQHSPEPKQPENTNMKHTTLASRRKASKRKKNFWVVLMPVRGHPH